MPPFFTPNSSCTITINRKKQIDFQNNISYSLFSKTYLTNNKEGNMMHKSLIYLTIYMALAPLSAHADPTADLFVAIESQNSEAVALALQAGADVDTKRTDGHNAKTCAFEQINLACHTPVPLFASSVAPLALVIASFLHNKNYALISLAGLITGAGLNSYKQNTPEEEHNFIQKITATLHLDQITSYASTAGLLASAWAGNQLLLSSAGTVGLATLYYQGYKLRTACEIYKMVDPEHSLIPELA